MIVPVILSGGTGSRLWPLSRELYPKQLMPLVNEQTMLQNTVDRIENIAGIAVPLVICNDEHRFMVAEQLRGLGVDPGAVILEPIGRNTAPAVAVAALQATAKGADPVLLILPADHVIADEQGFCRAVEQVAPYAENGHLLTFGIVPTGPETGYGYIKTGESCHGDGVYKVDRFVEKPDMVTAQNYVETGEYYWNSGMFMFRASRFLEELKRFAPEILANCQRAFSDAQGDLDFLRLDRVAFESCPSDSIDYAVMERTDDAMVMPLNVGWNDVGCWSSLWEVGTRDQYGNVLHGDVLAVDTRNSYVDARERLVATAGIDDLVVVETADAVLVAHKDRVQDIKSIVNQLKAQQRPEARLHRKVYRPWGSYECIDKEERFQVKRIMVNPGATLSLQMHHHRAEHWIVVKGTARILRGDEIFLLSENQSAYIPLGTRHRIENPGRIPLELIEVQSGSYLGEDDIVRFDDVYGRQDAPVEC